MNLTKTLFTTLCAITIASSTFAQAVNSDGSSPCVADSLKIESNTNWTVVANNFGAPINVRAKKLTYQHNSISGYYSVWISYSEDWHQYTYTSSADADSFMTLRYKFKTCAKDSVLFNFNVRRDNYCTVTLDGTTVLLNDAPTQNAAFYSPGTQISNKLFLDACEHTLDFKVYNRADITATNGFGLFVAGWLVSNSKVLFTNVSGCENYGCCVKTGISETSKKTNNISVYPNPTNNIITIKNSANTYIGTTYIIQNPVGQTIARGTLTTTETTVDLAPYANGLYLLKISGNNDVFRIIKN